MSLIGELTKKIDEKQDRMINIRRHLHENPELSFQEYETSKLIKKFYEDVNIDHFEANVSEQLGHMVTIKGAKPGKTIALRADFDALPITEDSGLEFSSKNPGVMHACGHDAHTAYMLILAESIAELKHLLKGTVKILHQPAEEVPPGGALGLIAGGALENVDYVFGIHVMSELETGKILTHEGATMSSRDKFKLIIKGRAGHGSSPHMANDAIVAASSFVMNSQHIVSRKINPFEMGVVTIGSFDGRGQFNIIKDNVELEGDVRSMSNDTAELIKQEIIRLVEGLEKSYGVDVTLEYQHDYPVLHNDSKVTSHVNKLLKEANINEITSVEEGQQSAPSEDFAYYLEKVPGTFIVVGAAPEDKEKYPHHHPKFIINEQTMIVAAKAMAVIVNDYVG